MVQKQSASCLSWVKETVNINTGTSFSRLRSRIHDTDRHTPLAMPLEGFYFKTKAMVYNQLRTSQGRWYPPAETRYPVHEQELLAILFCCKKWRHYILNNRKTSPLIMHLWNIYRHNHICLLDKPDGLISWRNMILTLYHNPVNCETGNYWDINYVDIYNDTI